MFVLAPGASFGREEYVQPSVSLVRIPGQSSKVTARAARLDPAITRVAVTESDASGSDKPTMQSAHAGWVAVLPSYVKPVYVLSRVLLFVPVIIIIPPLDATGRVTTVPMQFVLVRAVIGLISLKVRTQPS
jgi:hypothetical protein